MAALAEPGTEDGHQPEVSAPVGAPPMWPPLIHRPERQRRGHRRLYQLVTLVAWAGWAYLFLPLVTLLLWVGGMRQVWIESERASLAGTGHQVDGIALAALVSAAILIVWGEIERRRFLRRPRRPVAEHDDVRSVSEGMQIRVEDVIRLRDTRRALVSFSPDGRALRIDGFTPSATRSSARS